MGKRRIVRRSGSKKLTAEQKLEREVQARETLRKAKASLKATTQPTAQIEQASQTSAQSSETVGKPIAGNETVEPEETIEKVTQGNFTQKNKQETTQMGKPEQPTDTKPTLRKKEKFEDKHKRFTTYVLKEHHQKLNEVKEDYGIPISEKINNALKEYFDKYDL